MNLAELEQKLIASARSHPPSDHVPYAFEKRIMARVGASPARDVMAFWARALWRAAASCVAIVVLLSAWSLFSPPSNNQDFSQQFANTVLAAVDQESSN